MRSLPTRAVRVAVMVVIASGFATGTEASFISVFPSSLDVGVGDPVSFDIVVSALDPTETVGGFSLLLSFDDTILTGTGYSVGTAFGPVPDDLTLFGSDSPLDFFVLADLSLTEAELKSLQGSGFTLLTVNFTANLPGVSPISLGSVFLSDYYGTGEIKTSAQDGQVCVGEPCSVPVPEPGVLALLATAGVTAVAVRRRRRS